MTKKFPMKKLGGALAMGALSMVLGCESVALMPRADVDERFSADRREPRGERDRFESSRNEVFGTIQEVDERRREIRLRADDGGSAIVRYDNSTRISDGNRDLRPDSLRSGDEVSVRLGRDSRGEQYADAIRVMDRRGSGLR